MTSMTNSWPRNTINETPITFENEIAYKHYKLIFPTNGGSTLFQISEIELLGTEDATPFLNTPVPANGARDIELETSTISWVKPSDPNTAGMVYNVYFSDDPNSTNPNYFGDNLVKTTDTTAADCYYTLPALEGGKTYYWRVDGVKNGTTETGPVWHFNTLVLIPEMTSITGGARLREGETFDITASYTANQASIDSVTWYLNDTPVDPADSNYSIAFTDTESTITILNVSAATEGDYYCVATNQYGSSARSLITNLELHTPWVWTGTTGNWSDTASWNKGTVPGMADDVVISTDGVVTYDIDGNFFYSNNITLEDNAQLLIPEGKRFGGATDADTITNIYGASTLITGTGNYFLIARNHQNTVNQTGGTVSVSVDRGFFFNDNEAATGIYNLNGGALNVNYTNTSTGTEWWSDVLGRWGNGDTFTINGGAATFTAAENSGRDFNVMRDSTVEINSGSATLNNFRTMYIGHKYDGESIVALNGGELNVNSNITVGDSGKGILEINGGTLNVSAGSSAGISTGSGRAYVNQTGGVATFDSSDIELGGTSDEDFPATYTITGGEISGIGTLSLYANSVFNISGSGASLIEAQAFTVESSNSAVLSIELDGSGCSIITVGADAEAAFGGADLTGLTLEVTTLDSYTVSEGSAYDILWAENFGITGADAITINNNSKQLFEYRVVDATEYGYPSGELLQIVANYNPESADFNSDGTIDIKDFAIFSQFWLWSSDEE